MNLRQSLLVRYLLIITAALILWPFALPLYYVPEYFFDNDFKRKVIYMDTNKIERMWYQQAVSFDKLDVQQINKKIIALHNKYPEATMLWVSGTGKTELIIPKHINIPTQWIYHSTIEFMKQNASGDQFTVIEYIGGDRNQGFMIFQVPFVLTKPVNMSVIDDKFLLIYDLVIFASFLFISWLFFTKIRKRLVKLQTAMTQSGENGIPDQLEVHEQDEIGQLGQAFNHMIEDLKSSKERELKEESLRKQLITNISHDLRTPLTVIRGHSHSLKKETLSPRGQDSLLLIENKVDVLSQLLENLLSYTLLSAGKYPMHKEKTDMLRAVRSSVASWYPVFEKEGFEVQLQQKIWIWDIDPKWFNRIMDNLFQNILRHAKAGQYVGVQLIERDHKVLLVIEDRGPGMNVSSYEKGAGIGLSIISIMLKEMNFDWEITSSLNGTKISLFEKN
ncbi:HAMP domain-containing sensor histidine kinase [Shimazuella kribbensis]|uniref:HAMP domain-containing sensor histidine kinase n=1 Tax=Shimazuella kribbensis TaxID=139808 RepID=UPI000416D0C5|nr:HAMP domain-containing sensor histidine kinase [Shimazuella kribbensis]